VRTYSCNFSDNCYCIFVFYFCVYTCLYSCVYCCICLCIIVFCVLCCLCCCVTHWLPRATEWLLSYILFGDVTGYCSLATAQMLACIWLSYWSLVYCLWTGHLCTPAWKIIIPEHHYVIQVYISTGFGYKQFIFFLFLVVTSSLHCCIST